MVKMNFLKLKILSAKNNVLMKIKKKTTTQNFLKLLDHKLIQAMQNTKMVLNVLNSQKNVRNVVMCVFKNKRAPRALERSPETEDF